MEVSARTVVIPAKGPIFALVFLYLLFWPVPADGAPSASRAITGRVHFADGGLGDVWVMGLPGAPVTATDGSYSTEAPEGWEGTVEPTLPGYRFEPASIEIESVSSDLILDFAATERTPGFSRLLVVQDDDSLSESMHQADSEDLILLWPGVYTATSSLYALADGVALLGRGGPEQVLLLHAENAKLTGRRQLLEGLTFESTVDDGNGLWLSEARGVRLRNCRFRSEPDAQNTGLRIKDVSDVLVEGSEWSDLDQALVVRAGTASGDLTVRQGVFTDNDRGLLVDGNPDLGVLLENAVLRDHAFEAADSYGDLRQLRFENVIFDGNQAGLELGNVTYPVEIDQVVFHGNFDNAVRVSPELELEVHNSLFTDNGCAFEGSQVPVSIDHVHYHEGWLCPAPVYDIGAGVLEADPLFVDPTAGDFTLAPDSPARGAGRDGQDLGAYGGPRGTSWDPPEPLREPPLEELVLLDGPRHLAVGERRSYYVEGHFERGYTGDVGQLVVWSSSDPAVLASLGGGEFEALQAGGARLIAELDGVRSEVEVRMHDALPDPPTEPDPGPTPALTHPPEKPGSAPAKALAEPSGWALAEPLEVSRVGHSVTLLGDGRVLVVGGEQTSQPRADVEIFDPVTGRWQRAASLAAARAYHTATLLGDGRVLVTGGEDDGRLSSAEVYDPAADVWTSAANLLAPRSNHTATLLTDGRVLVAGGDSVQPGQVSTSELYDPIQDRWFFAGPMPGPRSGHTATLLTGSVEGRVLSIYRDAAEIYDPLAFTWNSVAPPPRSFEYPPTSTLLENGQVLVAGGYHQDETETFLYDPSSDEWTVAGDMLFSRTDHRAVLLSDGRVLAAGGTGELGSPTMTELFDPDSRSWSAAGELSSERLRHGLVLLPTGRVLLVAGGGEFGETNRCEVFEPGVGVASSAASLAVSRYGPALTELADGRLMVAGGRHSGSVASVEIYDPETDQWSTVAPLATAGDDRTAILLPDGDVLVVGSFSAERWRPDTGTWSLGGPRVYPGAVTEVVLLDSGRVLAANVDGVELYDPETDSWSATGSMITPRIEPTLTVLNTGEVLATGGRLDAGGNAASVLASAEIYDPVSGTWRDAGRMSWPRHRHLAVLLPSGEVLVAGGDEGELLLLDTEIYDPLTGLWRLASQIATPRVDAAAVVLSTGETWMTGGNSGEEPLASTEIFEPITGSWRPGPTLEQQRERHRVALLGTGEALVVGGRDGDGRALGSVERLTGLTSPRRPVVTEASDVIRYGEPLLITGTDFGGGSEAHGGGAGHSAANHPVVQLQSVRDGRILRLTPDLREAVGVAPPSWFDDPMDLTVSSLPAGLAPGTYKLTVWRAGVPSVPRFLPFECSLAVVEPPVDTTVSLGESAQFRVTAAGARRFQWRRNGTAIPGATGEEYVTPPVNPEDAGVLYDVVIDSGCRQETSDPAVLQVHDEQPPTAQVVAPRGGEYWLLPLEGEPPRSETVVWNMADNVRVCRVEVALQAALSEDGPWTAVDGWPRIFESAPCVPPGLAVQNLDVELQPDTPPSGVDGSLYRIGLRVRDLAGLETEVFGGTFSIVRSSPDSVKTLVVTHSSRLESAFGEAAKTSLLEGIQNLIGHPQVAGLFVDLTRWPDLGEPYAAWDESATPEENVQRANELLFGRGEEGDDDYLPGVHRHLLDLLAAFPGVEYLLIAGDDRIVPMARIRDGATLWDESRYTDPEYGELVADGSAVAQALSEGFFLSDDPLALAGAVDVGDLDHVLALPDLAVGRLVEEPSEMLAAINSFLLRDGVLRLDEIDPESGHRVLVTGYDFLTDVAYTIEERWRVTMDLEPTSGAVDGELVGVEEPPWNGEDLRGRLCADGEPFGVLSLSGHATHYQEGFPGSSVTDVRGLEAGELSRPDGCIGQPLDLSGRLIYSVGCHGGLPVPGTTEDGPPSYLRDLPQTYLGLGVPAYVANSGFGWGLDVGIGYSERLVQIFTEELTRGGTVPIGSAVAASKLRYFLETRHFDLYHQKTLMQWTVFGLPMYTVATGIGAGESTPPLAAPRPPTLDAAGEVTLHRFEDGHGPEGVDLPPDLVLTELRVDLSAPGVYVKRDGATGEAFSEPGCEAAEHPEGCYYTLNGLAAGGSAGTGDLPLEPYLVYDSRLSSASQHGVLWLGGSFQVEDDWLPVFGEPVSNGGPGTPSSAPQVIVVPPVDPRWPLDPGDLCRRVDDEVNSVVVTAGEVAPGSDGTPWGRHRRYIDVDLEIFYLGANAVGDCDRDGPIFGTPPIEGQYHRRLGSILEWQVPVEDDPAGVWRVVAVVDDSRFDPETGLGSWRAVELALEDGAWRAQLNLAGASEVRYVLQAVDRHGNVSWYRTDEVRGGSPTGIELRLPEVVQVDFEAAPTDLTIHLDDHPDTVEAGSLFEYLIEVENRGPAEGAAVRVALDLPEGAGFRGFTSGQPWSCESEPGPREQVLCTLPFLEVGISTLLSVEVAAPLGAGWFEATAMVSSAGEDPRPEDNAANEWTRVVDVEIADVALAVDNGAQEVEAGAPVSYAVTLTNAGPATVEEAVLDLDLTELEDVSVTALDGELAGSSWSQLELAPGTAAVVQVDGWIPADAVGEQLSVGAWVALPWGLEDPNDGDNVAVDVDPVVDLPPRIVTANTVADTGDGRLDPGEPTGAAITQLLMELSEPVTGAELPGVQRLLAAGADGEVQTDGCSDPIGDDQLVELAVSWLEVERTVALEPEGGVLQRGRYRWQVCPGILDDAGQPLEDVPWHRDFAITVEHRLRSPNFDHGLEGWDTEAPAGSILEAASIDAGGATTSGSVRVAGTAPSFPASLRQCLEVAAGEHHDFTGRVLGVVDVGAPQISVLVEVFADPGCIDAPMATFEGSAVPVVAFEEWLRLTTWSMTLPEGVSSMAVHFLVRTTDAGTYEVLLDDLAVYRSGGLFRDGFESGDTSRWSVTVP